MCSLFGLIDFKGVLNTHTKNKILNTLARECQVRGTDATGIAYNFKDRLRIYKRPIPARKMKIHIPNGVNAVMGHTHMTTQGNAQFNQNNHPFLGHVDGNSFALAHNGVLWNDKELRAEENLPLTSVETDSYVAVQLLEQQKTLDFDSLQAMAEKVEVLLCLRCWIRTMLSGLWLAITRCASCFTTATCSTLPHRKSCARPPRS